MSPNLVSALMLLALGVNWGLSFAVVKIATLGGVPPIAVWFWQALGGGAILCLGAYWRGWKAPLSAAHVRFYVILGLTGFTIPGVNAVICVSHLPVGVMAVVVTLSPFLTYVITLVIGVERFNAMKLAGTILGFGGALLIVLPGSALPEPGQAGWALMALLTPTLYAISNIYAGVARPANVDSLSLAALMQGTNTVLLLPTMLVMNQGFLLAPPFDGADLALFVQMIIAAIGPFMFVEIVRRAGPVYLSQVAYISTTAGLGWGMLLFGERHSAYVWAAVASVLAGVLLITRASRSRG